MKATFRFTTESVRKALTLLHKKADAAVEAAQQGLVLGMQEFGAYVEKDQLRGRKSEGFGLNRQTGTLARSWSVQKTAGGARIIYASQYAAIHQYGGKIVPKNAKALAIPVSPEAKGHSPRDFSDLQFIPRRGKAPLLIRRVRKGAMPGVAGSGYGGADSIQREDIMFVLLKSVTIPKRLYIIERFQDTGRTMITNRIMRQIKTGVRGAKKSFTQSTKPSGK